MALTELEHTANEEARHGNWDALEAAQARIAELETALERWKSIQANEAWEANQVWNAALEAAADAVQENIVNLRRSDPDLALNLAIYGRDAIRALMKKEGE